MFCANPLQGRWLTAALISMLLVGCATDSGSRRPAGGPTVAESSPQGQLHREAVNAVRAGDPIKAEALFTQLTTDYPDLATPWLNRALLAHQRGAISDSANWVAEALRRDSQLAPAWNLQGVIAREANEIDAAESAYRQALNVDPDYAAAWLNLGILLEIWRGQLDAALRAYQRYQELSPTDQVDPRVNGWIADLQRRLDRGV